MKRTRQLALVVMLSLLAAYVARSYAKSSMAAPAMGINASSSPTKPNTAAASVVGHVIFDGQPPKPSHISMSSDPGCSTLHPSSITQDDFVVGTNGTLSNVVVYISEGLGDRQFDLPSDPVVMEQKGCMYQPHVLAVRANQKLRIVNNDRMTHNIHPLPANNREWNKAQPGGTTLEETFAREEIAIPVKCNLHPWMRSYIAVFKHPFFAVTGKDGSFDLRDLSPGDYTVQAWHEKLGTLKQKITVSAGEAKSVDFVFKAVSH